MIIFKQKKQILEVILQFQLESLTVAILLLDDVEVLFFLYLSVSASLSHIKTTISNT